MDNLERRLRERLKEVLDGNESELARLVGTDQQNINNFISGKVKKSHLWKDIVRVLDMSEPEVWTLMAERKRKNGKKKPVGNFKLINITTRRGGRAQEDEPRMIPIMGQAVGGEDGEFMFNGIIIGWHPIPPILEGVIEPYCIRVSGESMRPRYAGGELVFVDPWKVTKEKDDVIVQLHPLHEGEPPLAFVKRFVKHTPTKLILEQFNPAKLIEIDRSEVYKTHVIVGAEYN